MSIASLPWLPDAPEDFRARCGAVDPKDGSAGAALQRLATHRLSESQAASFAKALSRCRAAGANLAPLTPFRLGVAASATFDLIADALPAAAARHGVALDLALAPYDQVMRQALDPGSELNAARLDGVLIAVDHRWLGLDRPVLPEHAAQTVDTALDKLFQAAEGFRRQGAAAAILQTLAPWPMPLFGSFDLRVPGTPAAMIAAFNEKLVERVKTSGSFILDVAGLASRIGADRWFDATHWNLYKLPFAADCAPAYAEMLGRLLGAVRGKARKCLVLDLDNTCWGGVIGDDGLEGIVIGQGSAAGEAFLSVQRLALDLRERGIALAVSSKNDEVNARAPFREHRDMLLKEEHISVFRANWNDKPGNLEVIAQELSIGLDALVFMDDNPAERARMRAALPMVAVPELPADPSLYAWTLAAAGYFEAVSFSREDRERVASFAANSERAKIMAGSRDLGEYLAELEMVISFAPFDAQGRARIAQLVNKSNQFNLTTRRYLEQEIAAMEADPSVYTLQVRLRDRFGDLGMIGVVICRPGEDRSSWEIDSWLMSCRVLERRVEEAMLGEITAAAKARGIQRLIGLYQQTAKNGMVAAHYTKLGFEPFGDQGAGTRRFALNVDSHSPARLPMHIERTE